MVVLFSICIGCDTTETYKLKYEVTGTVQKANITYVNENGGTSDANNVSLPWTYSFRAKEGTYVWVHASKDDSGSITAKIYKDGKVLESSSSTIDGYDFISVSSWLS